MEISPKSAAVRSAYTPPSNPEESSPCEYKDEKVSEVLIFTSVKPGRYLEFNSFRVSAGLNKNHLKNPLNSVPSKRP